MQKRSYGSVTVFSLDRERILRELRSAAEELGERHAEVEAVWLFGSLARGDAAPGSDADVIVLLSASNVPFLDRMPRYHLDGVSIGVDLLPYTVDEFEALGERSPRFHKAVLAERVVLFQRSGEAPVSTEKDR